jgi:hypothetical protein
VPEAALQASIDKFLAAVPRMTEIRDLHEHFDEYERRAGKYRGKPWLDEGRGWARHGHPHAAWVVNRPDEGSLHIGAGDLFIDVRTAVDAALGLANRVLTALQPAAAGADSSGTAPV